MTYQQYPLLKPYLITRSLQPENQETPIQFIEDNIVKTHLLYRRNHFPYPTLSDSNFWITIIGAVRTPISLSLQDILRLPSKTIKVVLECSGNKRSLFKPKIFGEQWEKGAISQGYWKGVSLHNVLELSGITKGAKEVVIEGNDYGYRQDLNKEYRYARSLPLSKALHPDTIIAYEYNNKPIPFKHGFPFRLVVPQWYGMASVKWIKRITVMETEFNGPYQSIDYVYYPIGDDTGAFPVTTIKVNSTIQKPLDMQVLNTGICEIKGIAWTGKGYIKNVEISTDEGSSWSNAVIENQNKAGYEWTSWSYRWSAFNKGEYTIMARATDSFNRTQPTSAFWNRKGYGYNAIDKIKVKIE